MCIVTTKACIRGSAAEPPDCSLKGVHLGATCTSSLFLLLILAILPLIARSQPPISISNVDAPPEMIGEPTPLYPRATDIEMKFLRALPEDTAKESVETGIVSISKLLQNHPEHAEGYYLRALANRCLLKLDGPSILKDISDAISAFDPSELSGNLVSYYSFRAKLHFDKGDYTQALADLEAGAMHHIEFAERVFVPPGQADAASSPCTWKPGDLDTLVRRFPKDHRPLVFRGLFFVSAMSRLDENDRSGQQAIQDFQRATLLRPERPVAHFFLGQQYRPSFLSPGWGGKEKSPSLLAIAKYTKAITLDPSFAAAYAQRANEFRRLGEYGRAIKDYDMVLRLDPTNIGAIADRGLTKLQDGQYLAAANDLGEAILRKRKNFPYDSNSLGRTYEYRGEAYMKLGRYEDAVADYSQVIKHRLEEFTFGMSLKHIRDLYPEYDRVGDDELIRFLHLRFWAQFDLPSVFAELKRAESTERKTMVMRDAYEMRGRAYFLSGQLKLGVLDFQRIFNGVSIPSWAKPPDRWQLFSATNEKKRYIDAKSASFSANAPAHLWIKSTLSEGTSIAHAYEVNCEIKAVRITTEVEYSEQGNILKTSELADGWQQVVPETLGEQVYRGVCSAKR